MSVLMLSEIDQRLALCIVHQTMEHYVMTGKRYDPSLEGLPQIFHEPRGVFITLYIEKKNNEELRGCVGFPLPSVPFAKAIAYATYSSLTNDPRFPPVEPEELSNMSVEIEVLSAMTRIEYKLKDTLIDQIEIGKDGLLLQAGRFSGLLLPTVPTKYGWNAEQFVQALCKKAGVSIDVIENANAVIYKFQAFVFRETVSSLKNHCDTQN